MMGVSKKLGPLAMLNMLSMIVLAVIYWLIEDRMNYAAAAELEVSDYRIIARSVKYGMLIVLLTFGVFFMYELLKELRIHPMQYILIGAALAIFYLLLLSFSEKIGFTTAYIIVSIACILLIAWYLQFILPKLYDVLFVSGLLTVTYAIMYILLSMSEYNLVVGSILLFFILFAVMYSTRHIDWYAVGE